MTYKSQILKLVDKLHEIHTGEVEQLQEENVIQKGEIKGLKKWIDDLQAEMYINCVYCGHRYGPDDDIPATMAETLKEHIEQCPKHPMHALKQENNQLQEELAEARRIVRWNSGDTTTCWHRKGDFRVTYKGGLNDCPWCRMLEHVFHTPSGGRSGG